MSVFEWCFFRYAARAQTGKAGIPWAGLGRNREEGGSCNVWTGLDCFVRAGCQVRLALGRSARTSCGWALVSAEIMPHKIPSPFTVHHAHGRHPGRTTWTPDAETCGPQAKVNSASDAPMRSETHSPVSHVGVCHSDLHLRRPLPFQAPLPIRVPPSWPPHAPSQRSAAEAPR